MMDRHEYLTRTREFAVRGESLPHSRLTEKDVRFIRENQGVLTANQLAARFGVHRRTIDKVLYYDTWGHVV